MERGKEGERERGREKGEREGGRKRGMGEREGGRGEGRVIHVVNTKVFHTHLHSPM